MSLSNGLCFVSECALSEFATISEQTWVMLFYDGARKNRTSNGDCRLNNVVGFLVVEFLGFFGHDVGVEHHHH